MDGIELDGVEGVERDRARGEEMHRGSHGVELGQSVRRIMKIIKNHDSPDSITASSQQFEATTNAKS